MRHDRLDGDSRYVLLLSLAPFAYYLLAIFAARRFFPGVGLAPAATLPAPPPISILKPICGLDRETYENYASFCRQDYPEFEILFCADAGDPAIRVIENLIRDFPTRSIRLLIGSDPLGASDKVNKLCRMAREAKHEILVVSDSDVRVGPNFLRAIAASFGDPKVGGVTCLYRGLTDGSFRRHSGSARQQHGLRAGRAGRVASRKSVARFHARCGDGDHQEASCRNRRLRIVGRLFLRRLRTRKSPRRTWPSHRAQQIPVSVVYPSETLPAAFRHQVRWNLSIRYSRPWGHLGLIFTQGLPWTVLAAILSPSAATAIAYFVAYVFLRGAMAWVVGAWGMRDRLVRREFWVLPVRDAFAFIVWLASFFPQRIHWRGRQFHVRKKRLVAISSSLGSPLD